MQEDTRTDGPVKATEVAGQDERPVMRDIQYFKATKKTNRFNKNQKVWVRLNRANCLIVWFKYRGRGRYVSGTCDKFADYVGDINAIEVDSAFADRVEGVNV